MATFSSNLKNDSEETNAILTNDSIGCCDINNLNNALLPEKPQEPEASDCCGTGCTPCVYDIYEQELCLWKKECDIIKSGKSSSQNCQQGSSLSPQEYNKFVISQITRLTHDSVMYRFDIPSGGTLGLKVGQHIVLRWRSSSRVVTRQYTPVSDLMEEGFFDILIKIYAEGEMSQYVKTWAVGDEVEWRGPFGNFSYKANSYRKVVMLAAGTGIAPMVQVIQHILNNEDDETLVHLIYCCHRYEDILLKSLLDSWADYWNFSVHYILSKDNEASVIPRRYGDDIYYGRLNEDLVRDKFATDIKDMLVLICGTRSFDKDMVNYTKRIAIPDTNIFKF